MFKVAFEQVFSPIVFEEIEEARDRKSTGEYRLCCMTQDRLLEDGSEIPEEEDSDEQIKGKKPSRSRGPLIKVAKYIGNKWGGKYLRAPDIYWDILQSGCKFVRLGQIAELRFGIKTGANEFFYLESEAVKEWRIEKRFLRPVILRPAEIMAPEIALSQLTHYLFCVDQPRSKLRGTNAEKYIRWGETQGFHKTATCEARSQSGEWYRLQERPPAELVLPIINKMRLVLGLNIAHAQIDNNCIEIRPDDNADIELMAALMLGSFNFLVRHAEGRSYGRMLKLQTFEAARLSMCDPSCVPKAKADRLIQAFRKIKSRDFGWLVDEIDSPERQAFDREWLAIHGLDTERKQAAAMSAMYDAIRHICEDINTQEKAWIKDKAIARTGGNPQDLMKGKRGNRNIDEEVE
jgi:hypothetical protein